MQPRALALTIAIAIAAAACSRDSAGGASAAGDTTRAAAGDTTRAAASASDGAGSRVASAEGFQTPESTIYDADQDVWFVTNINGNPSQKDGNGFISRLNADGTVDSLEFIAGGKNGVTLNAPKGTAIVGDTLWVADIDAVRGFDKRTGAPVAAIQFGKLALFLNDIAVGGDGALYVTDTGIRFDEKGQMSHPSPDRIFKVTGREVTVAVEGDTLQRPNGIAWDRAGNRFIVASFGGNNIFAWTPGSQPTVIGTGPGQHDGVEILPDGRVVVTSWTDSSVFVMQEGGNRKIATGLPSPADLGVDPKTNRMAVPIFTGNRVEVWQLP